MFGSLIGILPTLLLEKDKLDALRKAIRERLRREVALNLETLRLLDEVEMTELEKIETMDFSAIGEIFQLPLPVNRILDRKLSSEVVKILSGAENKRYVSWSKGLHTEAQLLERVWQRITVLKVRCHHKAGQGDFGYVRLLMRAFAATLKD